MCKLLFASGCIHARCAAILQELAAQDVAGLEETLKGFVVDQLELLDNIEGNQSSLRLMSVECWTIRQ